MALTAEELDKRIIRYAELVPCRTAFIDAHTPGSDQKENFTIIGAGVSESPDQHVHLADTPGFNIGAAGQPPKCRNSLHTHRTAEVFFVLSGRWRFFWGRWGDAGDVTLEAGDIINLPTGMFRGFENIGTDYGMIMAVLGGDDAGGGVLWAPQVLEEATAHGLILGENGVLYDTKKGERLPADIAPMKALPDAELDKLIEPSVSEVIRDFVARFSDLYDLSAEKPVQVLGKDGLLFDRPGFEINFISDRTGAQDMITATSHHILMGMTGHWSVLIDGHKRHLSPGDTIAIPPQSSYQMAPAMSGEASLYRIAGTDDPAGPTWHRAEKAAH